MDQRWVRIIQGIGWGLLFATLSLAAFGILAVSWLLACAIGFGVGVFAVWIIRVLVKK